MPGFLEVFRSSAAAMVVVVRPFLSLTTGLLSSWGEIVRAARSSPREWLHAVSCHEDGLTDMTMYWFC
eukprot:2840987-Prorocentrum_lima.AAC.1